jgi:hypothetical protein
MSLRSFICSATDRYSFKLAADRVYVTLDCICIQYHYSVMHIPQWEEYPQILLRHSQYHLKVANPHSRWIRTYYEHFNLSPISWYYCIYGCFLIHQVI